MLARQIRLAHSVLYRMHNVVIELGTRRLEARSVNLRDTLNRMLHDASRKVAFAIT